MNLHTMVSRVNDPMNPRVLTIDENALKRGTAMHVQVAVDFLLDGEL